MHKTTISRILLDVKKHAFRTEYETNTNMYNRQLSQCNITREEGLCDLVQSLLFYFMNTLIII